MKVPIYPGLLVTAGLLLITLSTGAQDTDHVYLKSGSVIRGIILEIEPASHVKIEDFCGNIWYYKIDQVEKIASEPYDGPGQRSVDTGFDNGFVNMTSIGFLAGSANNEQVAPFSLLMVNGWRSEIGTFTGLGMGVEFLATSYFPLFVDLRYDLVGGDVVPYLLAKGGYSLPMAKDHSESDIAYSYSGGPLAGAGVGVKIRTRNHFAWDISLMYRYQQTSYTETYQWNNQEYDFKDIYNRIEIRLGFYID